MYNQRFSTLKKSFDSMSYQVLARKWRPSVFREMVGQEHVLKALINALDHGRLHHAYLFTGTRGVGKTTIARILAKCLNCEPGVSSEPCGQCSACNEIAEGRFIDLIEVDAASRTKVEDTRELLENVQYAPTRGRYKVYLIDEVHMLSSHSFNALLKTLEEPPPHVKFLLATTDPQKLPATVLSRCLQFNLKNMTPERIVGHLQHVLEQEMVSFEEPALWLLGRSADGSMRDALSLTDQAISFGSGKVLEQDVRMMLGTIDRNVVFNVIDALISQNAASVLDVVGLMSEHSPDYQGALAELLSTLHRVAVAQAVPDAIDNSQGDREKVVQLASQMSAEELQLYYQMGLIARRDLPLAPDPRTGFEMAMLRMLAFKPEGVIEPPTKTLAGEGGNIGGGISQTPVSSPVSRVETGGEPPVKKSPVDPAQIASAGAEGQDAIQSPVIPVASIDNHPADTVKETLSDSAQPTVVEERNAGEENAAIVDLKDLNANNWIWCFPHLALTGVAKNIAANSILHSNENDRLQFVLDEAQSTLFNETQRQRIETALSEYFNQAVAVEMSVGQVAIETPAKFQQRKKEERQQKAIAAIQHDPNINLLIEKFGAKVRWDSVEPVDD